MSWDSLEVVASAAIVGVAVFLLVLRSVLERPVGSIPWLIIATGVLAALVWTPPEWRTVAFVGAGAILGAIGAEGEPSRRVYGAVASGAFFFLIEVLVPGGTAAIAMLILVIIGYCEVRIAIKHLVRLGRTDRLVPGSRPQREVEIAGTVVGPDRSVPGTVVRAAGWKLDNLASDLLELSTEHGPVYVDLASATLETNFVPLSVEDVTALFESKNARLEPRMKEAPSTRNLKFLVAGSPAYVVGIPAWESAPNAGQGYRDTELVPVFRQRSKDTPPVFVADNSEREVRQRSWWTLATWAASTGVCALIAVLLFGFDL